MSATDGDDALGRALDAAAREGNIYAVVDAAHFEFLQDTLFAERLRFDALYLDEVDAPTIASGPHLVYPAGPAQIARLRGIVGDAPAATWWVWPKSGESDAAAYRHFRGLNMVEIPRDRFDQSQTSASVGAIGFEPVLFRYGDPNVLMNLLPVLYPEQAGRLFGGASQIIVDSSDHGTVRAFDRVEGDFEARRGMLRIWQGAQYDALRAARLDVSHRKIAAYLREVAAEDAGAFDDDALYALVETYCERARALGVRAESALGRWCFMEITSQGQYGEMPFVIDYMKEPSEADADRKVSLMLSSIEIAARAKV